MDPAAHAGQAVRGPKQKAPQYRACGATMRAADSDAPEQAFPATSLPVPILGSGVLTSGLANQPEG